MLFCSILAFDSHFENTFGTWVLIQGNVFLIAFITNVLLSAFCKLPNFVSILNDRLFFHFCWYLYKALNNPDLFRNINSKLQLVSEIVLEENNSEQPVADEKELNEKLLKLKKYMVEKKPFLNSSQVVIISDHKSD